LFQHGKALATLGEYKGAVDFVSKAHKLNPSNEIIVKLLGELEKKYKDYKTNENNLWRKAMGNTEEYVPVENVQAEVRKDAQYEILKECIDQFKNQEKTSKYNLPLGLSRAEVDLIEDLIKDMDIKLIINTTHGKNNCYLSKRRRNAEN